MEEANEGYNEPWEDEEEEVDKTVEHDEYDSSLRTKVLVAMTSKNMLHQAQLTVGKWFYDACIPFNAVNSFQFQAMADAIASICPQFKMPSYHQLRGKILEAMVKEVAEHCDQLKLCWKETGCSIMSDGWIDTWSRTLLNFLVYCPKDTMFLKSLDLSNVPKIFLFISLKRLDLQTLYSLLQKMLQIIELQGICYFKSMEHFIGVHVPLLNVCVPLVKVLMLADNEDRPSIRYLYEAMDKGKEAIQGNLKEKTKLYMPLWKIIDKRWAGQLHQPIHATTYYLNPAIRFSTTCRKDREVSHVPVGANTSTYTSRAAYSRETTPVVDQNSMDPFTRYNGRALIHGCVNSKERCLAFPRTPRLERWEPNGPSTSYNSTLGPCTACAPNKRDQWLPVGANTGTCTPWATYSRETTSVVARNDMDLFTLQQ
ncbi:hypothetical protein EJ110_NYTH43951 [Nymphaea thermarum]|nr:hypothetical protein EJ110_NYTH43951 [Nymphaea thermarum]